MIEVKSTEAGTFEIILEKTFDFESHKEFRQHIKDVMTKDPEVLALSFEQVEYLDSSALGMLMLAKREAEMKNARIVITNLADGHARKVLELVKFDQIFDIEYA